MGHSRLTKTDYSKSWPAYLHRLQRRDLAERSGDQPVVVRMKGAGGPERLQRLIKSNSVAKVVDNYDEQLAELLISENAQLYRANPQVKASSIADHLQQHYGRTPAWRKGSWVYYPWTGDLVHVLEERLFEKLRTIRNRDLITGEEQLAFYDIRVGCAGLSVGSHGAVAIVMQGGSNKIKISDGAVISGSNLNRIRTGVSNVGESKSTVIARQLFEMNPYLQLHHVRKSLTASTIDAFVEKPWPLDIIIDEIDDLEIKIRLRVAARRKRIPVLMVTDLGDDVMLDVERYDQDPDLPLFHGLAGSIEEVLDKPDMTQREWLKYATTIIGTANVPLRMQQSLLKVGSTLPTQPQLGGTAQMAGAVLAYAVRQIALGEPLKSGRESISLDHHLIADHTARHKRRAHQEHTEVLKRALDSL